MHLVKVEKDYLIFVFLAVLGLLQLVAVRQRWTGLLFCRRWSLLGYAFGLAGLGGGYAWFFFSDDRNVPGLEGWQLFSRFAVSAVAAVLVTLLVSSALHVRRDKDIVGWKQDLPPANEERGLEALRTLTYGQILNRWLRRPPGGGERAAA
ncbi:MAG: hypothetical protein FJZ89_04945 [Chloroflexi bacterium]|nr:hypothetical protein [Chloroflexota bacterium]